MIKLIASDVDGTLVGRDIDRPSQDNIDALRAASKMGVKIVIASGRSYYFAEQVVKNVGVVDYMIHGNGSAIRDVRANEELDIPVLEMSIEDGEFIVDVLKKYDLKISVQAKGILYFPREFFDELQSTDDPYFLSRIPEAFQVVDDVLEIPLKMRTEKYNISFRNKLDWQRLFDDLYVKPNLYLSSSWQDKNDPLMRNFEITSRNATKDQALEIVCTHLGIEQNEVLAFGDNSNDADMLRWAGIGVALKNANQDAKAASDWIAPANTRHGVAAGIKKYVLEADL